MNSLIENILEHARWAPSGDNMQTWRFEIINDQHFLIHGYDTRDHCVYDLEGRASQLAIGALMESIVIAASAFNQFVNFTVHCESETNTLIDAFLEHSDDISVDPLFDFLPIRSVQRRTMKLSPLSHKHKKSLEDSISKSYKVKWLDNFFVRLNIAWLMQKNGKLRLLLPEAFHTHSSVIEWNSKFSMDKIPDKAVGLDPIATKIMKVAMKSWNRVAFLNKFFFATILPRIELDFLPGIFCSSHFYLTADTSPKSVEDYLTAGRNLQRFWLTATSLGLQLQPEMTPVIFSTYLRHHIKFTNDRKLEAYSRQLANQFEQLLGTTGVEKVIFMGRIGKRKPPSARSLRMPLNRLFLQKGSPSR